MLHNQPRLNALKRHIYDYQLGGDQGAAVFTGAG